MYYSIYNCVQNCENENARSENFVKSCSAVVIFTAFESTYTASTGLSICNHNASTGLYIFYHAYWPIKTRHSHWLCSDNEFISLVSGIIEYTEEINVTEILFSADFETLLTSLTIALYLALFQLFYLDTSLFIAQELCLDLFVE